MAALYMEVFSSMSCEKQQNFHVTLMAALYMEVFTNMSCEKQQNFLVTPDGGALHGSFHEHELRETAKLPCNS